MKKLILVSFICSVFAVLSFAAEGASDNADKVKNKGEKATISGSIKCARCDLKTSKKCKKLLETADGKYIGLKGKKFAEWMKENKGVKDITATGRISQGEGADIKIMNVKKIEATKADA